ncbi:Imm53 family immunity protein [Butyrivibrio fibrisolvens]
MTCHLKNGHFEGFGGPSKLEEIIQRFKEWAQQ